MDLGRIIRETVRDALERSKVGGANVAAAVNVDGSGHTTAVYSDNDVTIIQRDGLTQVIRHDDPAAAGGEGGEP